MNGKTREILGAEADSLLKHECRTIARGMLHLPRPLFVDNIVGTFDRLRLHGESHLPRSGELVSFRFPGGE